MVYKRSKSRATTKVCCKPCTKGLINMEQIHSVQHSECIKTVAVLQRMQEVILPIELTCWLTLLARVFKHARQRCNAIGWVSIGRESLRGSGTLIILHSRQVHKHRPERRTQRTYPNRSAGCTVPPGLIRVTEAPVVPAGLSPSARSAGHTATA